MALFDWFTSDEGARTLAGLAGASVSAALEWSGILPAFRKIFIGFLSAYYLGPYGAPVINWAISGLNLPPSATASGFLMGLLGLTVIEIFVKAVRLKKLELGGDK